MDQRQKLCGPKGATAHVLKMLLIIALVLVTLSACQEEVNLNDVDTQAATLSGDAANGAILFQEDIIGTKNAIGCAICHAIEPDTQLAGPNLHDIGVRASTAVPNMDAAAYLRESIIDPNAYLVESYGEGSMYKDYGSQLSPQEIADLVAYMQTLK